MKSIGRRDLLKTLATISCASTVATVARGRTQNPTVSCSGNVLNVIIHGAFAITADDQNITLVMAKVPGHFYAAGTFGLERPLVSDEAGPLSYTLTVPGWKPVAPVVSDKTDIVVRNKSSFHIDRDPFCNIIMPATNELFRVSVASKGKRRIFDGPTGLASEPDLIPEVYVFQYTYSGGVPSLGDFWQADSAAGGTRNLHIWAAPPFVGGHAHAQGALDAFNDLFEPRMDLKLSHDHFDPPVTNIQCCGVTPQEVWSIPEARLHTLQPESESPSSSLGSLFQKSGGLMSNSFMGNVGKSKSVAPMFSGTVRTCVEIWVLG
jgi:hypothetical protein